MRAKVKNTSSEVTLLRVLDALAQEAIDASDEEIMEAAKDLGIDLSMKESAAFAGVTYAARPQLADFFDVESLEKLRKEADRTLSDPHAKANNKARRSKRPQLPNERKTPSDK
jgi:uncharacterized protein YbcC (UPF0753/DUF2309 family)